MIRTYGFKGVVVKAGDPLYDVAELSAITLKAAQTKEPAAEDAKIQALLEERLATLKQLAAVTEKAYRSGNATFAEVAQANALLLKAELELCKTDKERLAVHEKAVGLAKDSENVAAQLFQTGRATQASVLAAKANRLEAEIALQRAKARAAK